MKATTVLKFQGSKLRDARNEAGLSQSELGRRINAHATSISDWERGDTSPSGRHVASLSRELGKPVEFFYGSGDDEEDRLARVRRIRAELVLAGRDDLADELGQLAGSFA